MQIAPKNFYKKLLGLSGEARAEKFLKKKGYKIIEKNYSSKFAEVDLIALYGDFLVFIEVKTRSSDKYGMPREAVGKAKRQKYYAMAELYLQKHYEFCEKYVRFDVVEILADEINHIENAFDCD